MNRTESGAIAVGNPMSLARLQQEINHYCGPDGSLKKLIKTPEGEALIRSYMRFNGGYPEDMTVADIVTGLGDTMEVERMQYVCYGALLALQFSMIGRIPEKRAAPTCNCRTIYPSCNDYYQGFGLHYKTGCDKCGHQAHCHQQREETA
jgi:hypothetical protein